MNWVLSTLLIQLALTVIISLIIILIFKLTHKDKYTDDI